MAAFPQALLLDDFAGRLNCRIVYTVIKNILQPILAGRLEAVKNTASSQSNAMAGFSHLLSPVVIIYP